MGQVQLPPNPRGLTLAEAPPPDGVVAMILAEGETDFAIVDFPRKRKDGTVIARVHVRPLSDEEWASAEAQAIAEYGRLVKAGEPPGSDLKYNLTVRHILAVACRDEADPKKQFFPHGAFDVRRFHEKELSELWRAYAVVKLMHLPSLGEMTGPELEAWASRIEEGVESFPFYFASQECVVAFLNSVARYVASKSRPEGTSPPPDGASTTSSSGPV